MTFQTHNYKKNKTPVWLSIATLFATGLITASVAHAQATPPVIAPEPAQKPLVTVGGTSAAPNIMIIYDDSGSMANIAIPDAASAMSNSSYHPSDAGTTNGVSYYRTYQVVSTENTVSSALIRSHQINPLYYNPATTYTPWKAADGKPIIERKEVKPKAAPNFASIYLGKTPSNRTTLDLTAVNEIHDFGVAATTGDGRTFSRSYCNQTRGTTRICLTPRHQAFTPAVYFIYKGPDANKPDFSKWSTSNPNILDINNYKRISIMEDIPDSGSPELRGITQKDSRTDCTSLPSPGAGYVKCSRDEEMQNFTIWYVFYRDRIRAATGALSQVFSQKFDVKFRLAWTALNKTHTQGVREFDLNTLHATNFFNWIFNFEDSGSIGSTPTLGAIQRVGEYFKSSAPWYDDPAKPDTSKPKLACRRNYTILMTDGGWNDRTEVGTFLPSGNGLVISRPKGDSYQYKGVLAPGVLNHPYYDNNGGVSLARATLYYWATDLRDDLPNILPGSGYDGSAFWQNMITHTIGFGVSGLLDYPGDLDALTAGTKVWSDPGGFGGSELGKIDDLWHAAINGQGTYASASNLDELIESISSILTSIAVGEVLGSNTAILTDNLSATNNVIYSPQYLAGTWSGNLVAYNIKKAASDSPKVIEIDRTTAKWKASEKVPAHGDRNIWVGVDMGKGSGVETVDFTWGSISSELKNYLDKDKKLLDYIRGDNSSSAFRKRDAANTLGDIVNSNPVVVKTRPNVNYPLSSGYQDYRKSMENRPGMVFIGANDGMLHGFDIATGVEKFAYIPYGVTAKLSKLAEQQYETNHTYFVDGPLALTDANFGGEWSNILIGTAGAGGKSIFAMDVTSETAYTSNSTVMWDISDKDTGLDQLGYVMQPVQTGYAKTGDWVGVFGNGAYGKNGHAIFYVVNLKTGALEKEITVDATGGNGLMAVTLVKNDSQEIIEAYGTDLKGNLWRVNLNGDQYNTWGNPHKLFTTINGRAITQIPITKDHPKGGRMVVFGTGKFFDYADTEDEKSDSLYGIWDRGTNDFITASTDLIVRTVSADFKLVGNTAEIDWDIHSGWTLPLTMITKNNHRSLYSPRPISNDAFFDTTLTEISDSKTESCDIQGLKGVTFLLDMFGGGKPKTQWDANNDGIIDNEFVGGLNPNEGPGHTLIDDKLGLNTGGIPGTDQEGRGIIFGVIDNYSWVTLR